MSSKPTTINVYLDSLSEEERKEFLTLDAKAGKPKSNIWKPVEGDIWFSITTDGHIISRIWNTKDYCEQHYALGNCFKTFQEAEFACEKQKVLVELKRFAEEHNEFMDWSNIDVSKWCIMYNHTDKTFYICSQSYIQSETINFSSKEIAQKAIEYIGEDRLKKYYFEVQEEQND